MSLRSDLADYLRSELAGVNVYEAGADVVATPAVVINPSDPYVVPVSFGQTAADTTVAIGLELWLVVGRPGPVGVRLDELEALAASVIGLLHSSFTPTGRWGQLGNFGVIEIAGVEHATAQLEYLFKTTFP